MRVSVGEELGGAMVLMIPTDENERSGINRDMVKPIPRMRT
jgi:hypothetical protein